jgi:fatty-acyl-CoA synthase
MELSYEHASRGRDSRLRGLTTGRWFQETVERCGDVDALVSPFQDYRATYAELWEQTTAAAKALIASGVSRGDHVGLWSPNRYEWVIMQVAAARVGAVQVNVSSALRTDDLRHVLRDSAVKVLVYAPNFRATQYEPLLAEIRGDLPRLEREVMLERDWAEFLEQGRSVSDGDLALREASLQPDDPCNIQYTSGTTGIPKGVLLSHHILTNNAASMARTLGYSETDRLCNPMPFHHSFGMTCGNLACLVSGATIVIPGNSFDPDQTLQVVERERCTVLYGVPTMFIKELAHPKFQDFDLSSLRAGVMGGAPCPVSVMKQLSSDMNIRQVSIIFGQTEGGGTATQTRTDSSLEQQTTTVGQVVDDMELKIVDENDAIVPRGQQGEICLRGYSTMLGYWADEEATRAVIDPNGWLHMGDLGVMDAKGYVSVSGRKKDMIIRGGQNIYPREVEEFLHGHPNIEDVYVVGVPSETYGEEVAAFVQPREGVSEDAESLRQYCVGRIATYKIPAHWSLVDGFPVTASGKVRKFVLREQWVMEQGHA